MWEWVFAGQVWDCAGLRMEEEFWELRRFG